MSFHEDSFNKNRILIIGLIIAMMSDRYCPQQPKLINLRRHSMNNNKAKNIFFKTFQLKVYFHGTKFSA
jgi:hypothetical protein